MKIFAVIVPDAKKGFGSLVGTEGTMSIEVGYRHLGRVQIALAYGKFKIETGDTSPYKIEIMNRHDNDKIAFFYVDDVITKAKEFVKGT